MSPTRVRPPLRRVTAGDDAGFTVVESLVAFVILLIASMATLATVLTASDAADDGDDRAAATNLVQRDLQAARSLRFPAYPQARTATLTDDDGGATRYRLTRSVSVRDGAAMTAGTCPATPNFTTNPYMVVTTTVTWVADGDAAAGRKKVSAAAVIAC